MNKRLPRFVFIISLAMGTLTANAVTANPFEGLGSKAALEKIKNDFSPKQYAASPAKALEAVKAYSKNSSDTFVDYFSGKPLSQVGAGELLNVVPQQWFDQGAEADALADLHNIVTTHANVAALRADYPPGNVDRATVAAEGWKCGVGTASGMETNLYEPAPDRRGDLARIYMYVSAVYPQSLWHRRAAVLFADGFYPLLTAHGRNLLLDWHNADPVDDFERARDAAIAQVQGNSNPFVSVEGLPELVWGGEHALKSHYSISADERLWLSSPFIPSGAKWKVDGNAVSGESIALEKLACGKHELEFTKDNVKGKMIFTLEP